MSTTSIFANSTSSTTHFPSTTTGSIMPNTTTNHTTNKTTNHTSHPYVPKTYPPEIWFFVLNPIFILILMITAALCLHSIYKIMKLKREKNAQQGRRTRIGVLTCVIVFAIIRSFSLGIQIRMGISTTGMTQMFDIVRIASMFGFYGAMLVILRKWTITCVNVHRVMQSKTALYRSINIVFAATHLFIYAALLTGIGKDSSSLEYSDTFDNVYESLVIVTFGILLISFSVSGGFLIYKLKIVADAKQRMHLKNSSAASSEFIKKMARSLGLFLVCMLWRMIDYAIYEWAKTPSGQWVYSSTMQIDLYPLEATFPEVVPMVFCFLLYRERLWFEKETNVWNKSASTSTTDLTKSASDESSNKDDLSSKEGSHKSGGVAIAMDDVSAY